MAGLFRNDPATPEGKYLVKRRDGTVPEWPCFVIGAKDPAAPAALRAYAKECGRLGLDIDYVTQILDLAVEFEMFVEAYGPGDPDAPNDRKDDPDTVAQMRRG
jgi:hypothetical protein